MQLCDGIKWNKGDDMEFKQHYFLLARDITAIKMNYLFYKTT